MPIQTRGCPSPHCPPVRPGLRSVRPSLVDLRFSGDPWVVAHPDGSASLLLNNFRLARILSLPLDVPSFNSMLLQLRQWQARRLARRIWSH